MKRKHLISSLIAASLAVTAAVSVPLTSAAAGISGDVNSDGKFDIADAVVMQKWLLGRPDAVLSDWEAGDMNKDGLLDIFDFCFMQRKLTDGSSSGGETPAESTGFNITFSGSSVTIADDNGNAISDTSAVSVSGQTVTVKKPGEYSFSGSSENGQIIVDVDKNTYPEDKVTLSLAGLTLSNPNAAPIYVASVGDECVISAKKDTVNKISDGTSHTDTYTDSDGNQKQITAAVFSRDDLKIKGKGTLTVNGNTNDGIVSTDDLKIFNSTLSVTAADDGIVGKESVTIGDKDDEAYDNLSVTVKTTTGDGIKSTNHTKENKGTIVINGGKVSVESHSDAIQAARDVTVNGGEINIKTYQGVNYTPGQNQGGNQGGDQGGNNGGWGGWPGGGWPGGGGGWSWDAGHDLGLDFSAKGIKAGNSDAQIGGTININGGEITIDSTDDAVHCGDTLTVTGGTTTVKTADDGLHCDKYLYVKGGKINVTESYEGLEAMQIYIKDGDITVYAEDDPTNCGEKGAAKTIDVGNDNCILQIDGGTLHIYVTNNMEGDGLDSNGNIYINGGFVYAEGSVDGPDSALDADGHIYVAGGTLVATGGLGRGELPETSSTQPTLYWGDNNTKYPAGSVVALLDSSGREILSYKTEQAMKCAAVSSPEVKMGGNYTLTVNGNKVADFTVTSGLNIVGDHANGGFGFSTGGNGGWGF